MEGFPRGLTGYAPVELVARSTSGLVIKARRLSTGQHVAIKTPHPDAGPAARERIRRSARLKARLNHPHIACLIDAGQAEGGRPYAISEFVPGETLRQFLLRNGPLEVGLAGALMGQLLDALACVHAGGIIHRDLKPQNVIVTSTGVRANIKLIDFGMAARPADADVPPPGGTPGYCAPEQLRGAPPTPAADLYAWGLLFIECLTGRPAVAGLTAGDLLEAQRGPQPVPIPPGVHEHGLEPLLRGVLSGDPSERAGEAAALHAQLRRCMAPAAGSQARPAQHPTPPVDPRAWSAPVLCVSIALTPLDRVGLDLSLLGALQEEQQRWCRQAVLAAGGRQIGALGDRLLFHFGGDDRDESLRRAVSAIADVRGEAARRSRLLEIRYGVRLSFRAGLHRESAKTPRGGRSLDRAAGAALRLNAHADPGAVVVSGGALRRLRTLRLQERDPPGSAAPADTDVKLSATAPARARRERPSPPRAGRRHAARPGASGAPGAPPESCASGGCS